MSATFAPAATNNRNSTSGPRCSLAHVFRVFRQPVEPNSDTNPRPCTWVTLLRRHPTLSLSDVLFSSLSYSRIRRVPTRRLTSSYAPALWVLWRACPCLRHATISIFTLEHTGDEARCCNEVTASCSLVTRSNVSKRRGTARRGIRKRLARCKER
jgi:hypothetical protein